MRKEVMGKGGRCEAHRRATPPKRLRRKSKGEGREVYVREVWGRGCGRVCVCRKGRMGSKRRKEETGRKREREGSEKGKRRRT